MVKEKLEKSNQLLEARALFTDILSVSSNLTDLESPFYSDLQVTLSRWLKVGFFAKGSSTKAPSLSTRGLCFETVQAGVDLMACHPACY